MITVYDKLTQYLNLMLKNRFVIFSLLMLFLHWHDVCAVEKVVLQLKWIHNFQFAGYYAAKEQGFYAEEGLDVELQESTPDKTDYIAQVLQGAAQYGVADTGLLHERLNGKPVVVLASIFQHNPLVLVTLKKSGIVSPHELIGKKVMSRINDDAPLYAAYHEAGIDPKKLIQVEHSFNLDDLINGKVDAVSVYLTSQVYELQQRGIAYNIIDPRNYGVDFLGDNLFTTEQEIAQHPDRVRRFLRASLKGWDYALKHPNDIIEIIFKKYNPKVSKAQLQFEASQTIKMILPDLIPLGSTDIKRFERAAEAYLRQGLVKSTERLQGFVYRQSVNAHRFTLAEQAWLRAHPVLKVGIHSDFAPFEWLDNKSNYVGLTADYLNLIADYLDVKFDTVTAENWQAILNQAKTGELDLLANVNRTLNREQFLDFSESYLSYPIVIIDNGKGAYIKDLKQLSGKQVIVNKGYFLEELLKRDHPELTLSTANSVQEALKKLNNGEADAYIGDAVSAHYAIKKEGLFGLRITGETEYRNEASIAVTKNNQTLLSLINKALADITPLQQNTIQNRWLNVPVEPVEKTDWQRLSKYLAVIAIFILLIIYWNLRLQRAIQVSKQLERALRDNENRLHTIINVCPVPLVLNDTNQQITFVNPEFTKCFGYTLDDVATLTDWWLKAYPDPIYRQHIRNAWLTAFEKTQCGDDFAVQESTVHCKDGSTRTVLITITSLGHHFKETHLVILYDMTTRKASENELQRSLALLQAVINNIPMRVFWKDLNCRYMGANAAFAEDAGFNNVEELIGKDDSMTRWSDKAEQCRAEDQEIITTQTAKINFEEQRLVYDGTDELHWFRHSKVPLYQKSGQMMGVLGIYEDITESKLLAEKLHLAASVFANTQEGIVITDAEGTILDANKAFIEMTGYQLTEILGKNPRMFQSGRHEPDFYEKLWRTVKEQHYWHGEVWNRRKNGEIYTEWLTITAVTNADNQITGYIGTSSDISLLKQREQQLEQLTHYDPLTGIPNRVLLADRMQLAIAQSKRSNTLMAVCYLDLDGFESVNERFGHKIGDQLLIEITSRIKHTLREEDTIARLGGDEFAFLLQDLNCVEDCEHTLHRLLKAISKPTELQNQSIVISASVGISIYPEDDSPPEILLRHASQAMYQTKQEGKNSFHIYNIELDRQIHAHRTALNRIEIALENGEFELYFQPKVDTQKGIIFGAEALIRWQHLERGLVMPKEFLPLIENNEFANRLDAWVIDNALQHIADWQKQGLTLKISINISARSLQSVDFTEKLHDALLRQPSVNPNYFELEILETEILNDLNKTSKVITACQAFGVQFALDDFGTGYSSLSYLRHLPVQTLKIDQSFVRDMLEDENDLAIVRSVIGLAESFNRQVIAEGVESIEHGKALMAMGCKLLQGYAIAKPMPANDFEQWLQDWQIPSEWQSLNFK